MSGAPSWAWAMYVTAVVIGGVQFVRMAYLILWRWKDMIAWWDQLHRRPTWGHLFLVTMLIGDFCMSCTETLETQWPAEEPATAAEPPSAPDSRSTEPGRTPDSEVGP